MQLLILAVLCFTAMPDINQEPAWQRFSSVEGRFSARMPTEPRISTRTTPTSQGMVLTQMVSSSDENLNEFMVSWTEYKSSDFEQRGTDALFNRIRDALVGSQNGKVLSESAIDAGGHPARSLAFSTSDGRLTTVRFYFVQNRFYQVMAQTRPGFSEMADRFFESFKLIQSARV